ncbi:phosphate-starvation-inducible PsiE family protein [Acidithiobacillus sp.]
MACKTTAGIAGGVYPRLGWQVQSAFDIPCIRLLKVTAGFLNALGTLFIVWVLSALISAEITYMRSGIFHVEVFFEVAMITLLRQLILIPVKGGGEIIQQEDLAFYAVISGALLVTGIADFLVARSQLGSGRQAPRRPDVDQANDHSLRDSR